MFCTISVVNRSICGLGPGESVSAKELFYGVPALPAPSHWRSIITLAEERLGSFMSCNWSAKAVVHGKI